MIPCAAPHQGCWCPADPLGTPHSLPPCPTYLVLRSNPPKTCRAKLQLNIICPGLGLKGLTGWFPFGAPHTVAASPWWKLSSYKDSALSCPMPGLGWQPQLEAGQPLLLSLGPLHIRSLGFLAAWRSWSSWASSLAVVFSQNECSKGLRHKLPGIAFLYSISQVPARPDSRGRGTDLLSLWRIAFTSRERRQTST